MRGAKAAKAAAGGYVGGPRIAWRYGYRLEQRLDGRHEYMPVAEEQEAIRDMASRYLQGETLRQITDWLQESGIPNVTGRPWAHQAVGAILKREGESLRRRGRAAPRAVGESRAAGTARASRAESRGP